MKYQNLYRYFQSPKQEYLLAITLSLTLAFIFAFPILASKPEVNYFLWLISIIGALPIFLSAIKSIKLHRITIELFNLFALVISFFLDSPLAAIWIELMLTFASYLEWRTKERASNAVMELLKLSPTIAHLEIQNGQYKDVDQTVLKIGDIVLIKEGEKAPIDGIIFFGDCIVDESSFTGESMPKEKSINDQVFAGTIVVKGVIKVKTTSVGSETVLGKMIILMQQALTQKANIHKFADRFAELFLPITAIVAVIIYWTTQDFLLVAAFLLVICADDIAVAIPLAMEASLLKAAKRGVIIKGGISLEKIAKVKTIVFDKTGTLTHAKFSVDFVNIEKSVPLRQFWLYVAIAEKFSEHPIGREIYKEAVSVVGKVDDPDSIEILKGAGVLAKHQGSNIIIGNNRAMISNNIDISHIEEKQLIYKGKTALYVANNNEYVGCIYVSDTVKIEARDTIEILNRMNIHTVLLTGDSEDVAIDIGEKVGVKEIRAGLSPEDKLNAISEYSKMGVVVMIGDGVNDAPALGKADIGIAMGKLGAAVSVEAADIIIQTDDLSRIPEIIELSRLTRRVIIGNFVIWFVSNTIGTILVLNRYIGVPFASFYNFATDFLPLMNSARLFRNRR